VVFLFFEVTSSRLANRAKLKIGEDSNFNLNDVRTIIYSMSSAIKDYSLAARLRSLTASHLLPFANPSQTFRSDDLRSLLTTSLGYREYEVSYELMKILFTSSDKYQSITLDELVLTYLP
jgi:hypothetical protein